MDWKRHYEELRQEEAEDPFLHPQDWQMLLAERVREAAGGGRLLEAGCGLGGTSLAVGASVARVLLDAEPKAIQLAQAGFARAGQTATFTVGDLFHLPFRDASFAVVFNAGVVEHFGFAQRRAALCELARVTRPGGRVIVAFPNHYWLPYRFAYRYRKARGTWRYPEEERIYDLAEELRAVEGLVALSRETCAEEALLFFLNRWQQRLFRGLRRLLRFEGYLTIVTLQKQ
jgi:ubiquinone/menaquinone biosynthesis C-methylase UbiE